MGDIGENEREVEYLPIDEPAADQLPVDVPEKVPGKVPT